MQINDLSPWMRGPFELIRHADGHLKVGEDTDRRIALIGFDNAIEVCIDVFLNLPPKVRKGLSIKNEKKDAALKNYHSKIEFLEEHIQSQGLTLATRIEEIVWYHQLRNELYHSGNGMVPEMHVLEGARKASVAVFHVIFEVDIWPLLGQQSQLSEHGSSYIPSYQVNDEMEFLRAFIEFEKTLRLYASILGQPKRISSQGEIWKHIVSRDEAFRDYIQYFDKIFNTRNLIVHGQAGDIERKNLSTMIMQLENVTEQIKKATHESSG